MEAAFRRTKSHERLLLLEKNALKQRIITYIGWLGFTNLGDEAFCDVNKRLFSKYRLVPSGHWSSQKQYSKITLFGGGSLLPVWTWLIKPNRYNYALGVGVRDPKSSARERVRYLQVCVANSYAEKRRIPRNRCLLLEVR